jgi:hypothetical protein
MNPGDSIRTSKPIRSQKTGIVLPRQGTYISSIENLGRKTFLVDFGSAGEEYLFLNEILTQVSDGSTADPFVSLHPDCCA